MWVTDTQVKILKKQLDKNVDLTHAALKAGMDRKTARRYRNNGLMPSECRSERTWRTRADPFVEDWPVIQARLEVEPALQARTLFDLLQSTNPEKYTTGQLRTLQRKVKEWRAQSGPAKEVFFPQVHRPGEALQTDFTEGASLRIVIGGEPFVHLLCHCVLPYSNWSWATICSSESLSALKQGVQAALRQLGGRPTWHQTDNSTAATHRAPGEKRTFNLHYLAWMDHIGFRARTIGVGKSEQNGDVESLNGALKRRIDQALLLRGSRNFETEEGYRTFLEEVLRKSNGLRGAKFIEEQAHLEPLCATMYPEYQEEERRVSIGSTVRVLQNTYSVPSRLIGERVRLRIYEGHLEVWFADRRELCVTRRLGRNTAHIDYRHIIASLVRKPGAFARYRYREELFPTLRFRRTYDALLKNHNERHADREYIRILNLAAMTSQSDVETALELAQAQGVTPAFDTIRDLVAPTASTRPILDIGPADLARYDQLLPEFTK